MMIGTPESRMTFCFPPSAFVTLAGRSIGFSTPSTMTVIAERPACHHSGPLNDAEMIPSYSILLGSEITSDGCRPMPRREGVRSDSGRSRESEKKRWQGAVDAGVMLKRFEERVAPSGHPWWLGGPGCR